MPNQRLAAYALAAVLAVNAHGQQPRASGQVYVSSEPADAIVALDGVVKGKSPLTIEDVAPGRHIVTLNKHGYRETRRGITVAAGQRLPVEATLDPVLGLVLIHSKPEGANVVIEGADKGNTPLLVTDLALGSYRVRVSTPGYEPKEVDLAVRDRVPMKIEVELQSNSAILSVMSTPPGAQISVNGIIRGTAPCRVDRVPVGECSVEARLEGFAPYLQSLRLAPGREETLDVVLRPLPATLKIVTLPKDARVYINNNYRGPAPVSLDGLDPGMYRVRVDLAGHESAAQTVTLDRGEERTLEFMLEPNVGTLEITTEPAGARVFVDGKPSGQTATPPGQAGLVSSPLKIPGIPAGRHEVRVTRDGHHTQIFEADIERDRTLARHVRLKRRFVPDYEVRTDTKAYRGVLVEVDPLGNVRLEISPGIIRTIEADEIRSSRKLRLPDSGDE
jgi:hypothetical protein